MTPEQWQIQLEAALVKTGVVKALGGALATSAMRAQRAAVHSLSASGGQRSGALQRSIRGRVHVIDDNNAEVIVQAGGQLSGSAVRYAAIQEYGSAMLPGGVIRPKKAKYLSIPIHPNTITPAGVSRYLSPRDVPEPLHFIEAENGKKYLSNEAGEPYYALLSSVTIKPRRYLRAGRDEALKKLGPDIAKALTKLLKPGGGNG